MEIKKILEHTCFQKDHPLSPVRCRCRHYISVAEATKLIASGAAQFVIESYKTVNVEEICPVCLDQDELRSSCVYCNKIGKVKVDKKIPIYGEDVITSVEQKGGRLRSTIAKKTPRSPTIEKNHILRSIGAIGGGASAAKERLDEYQLLTLKEQIRLMVPNITVQQFDIIWRKWLANDISISPLVYTQKWLEENDLPFPLGFRYEPPDDVTTMTGRRYDYGRSI